MEDYSDRLVRQVLVYDLKANNDPSGNVQGSIRIELIGISGDRGPSVTVDLAVDNLSQLPFVDVEARLLEAALAVLKRLSAETSESIAAQAAAPPGMPRE